MAAWSELLAELNNQDDPLARSETKESVGRHLKAS